MRVIAFCQATLLFRSCGAHLKVISHNLPKPNSKVSGANTWGRHDPGWAHVGPMNLAIWEATVLCAEFENDILLKLLPHLSEANELK